MIISEPTTKHVFVAWLNPRNGFMLHWADEDGSPDAQRGQRACGRNDLTSPSMSAAMPGSACPRMYEICRQNNLTYTFGFATNPRLKKRTFEPLMNQAVEQHQQTNRNSGSSIASRTN